jgi:F0F1-type ATP synthase membrane subunit b/b'
MPQLDALTFLSQFTWLLIFFMVLYFRVVLVYLPPLAGVLKLRKKTKEQDLSDIQFVGEYQRNEAVGYEDALKDCMSQAHGCFQDSLEASSVEVTKAFTKVNQTTLQRANALYLSTLLNLGLTQVVGGRLVASGLGTK